MANSISHNHAAYRQDSTGRYVIHKNLRLGTNGNSGPAFFVEDTTGEAKLRDFERMSDLKGWLLWKLTGLETAPHFGALARDGKITDHPLKLDRVEDYYEITG